MTEQLNQESVESPEIVNEEAQNTEEIVENNEENQDDLKSLVDNEEEISNTEEEGEESEENSEDEDSLDIDELRKKKIKIDGEDVDFNELKSGYMRTKDYTQKTQELAEFRNTYETVSEGLKNSDTQLRDLYNNTEALFGAMQSSATQEIAAIEDQLKSVDWGTLKESEFTFYQGLKNKREKLVDNFQAVIGQMEAIKDNYEQASKEAKEKLIAVENKKLQEKYPAFKDKEKSPKIRKAILGYLEQAYGEEAAQVSNNITDHRDVITILKATLYDEMQEQLGKPKKVSQKSPVIKKGSKRDTSDDVKSRGKKNDFYKAKRYGGRKNSAKLLENVLFD